MTMASTTISLNLEKNPIDCDRHLYLHQDYVYAYGGPNGTISVLALSDIDKSASPTSSPLTARIMHRYDDSVRALAFSRDGQRVAVGFDDGSVDIYSFSLEELNDAGSGSPLPHPFSGMSSGKDKDNDNDNANNDSFQDDGLEDLFTQDKEDEGEGVEDLFSNSVKLSPTFRLNYRSESSIRALQFDPRSNAKADKYFLAIASDSKPGLVVVDATTESSMTQYLSDESEKAHDQDGLRSLAYSPDGSTLATLTHKGRLCLWDVEGDDPEIDWELMHRDGHIAVKKPDMSAFHDHDSGDRSICPVWSDDGLLLGLPGEKDLHFRRKGVDELRKDFLVLPSFGGDRIDKELIGMAFDPSNEGYVVTSSRDGKINVWKIASGDNMDEEETAEGEFLANIEKSDSICTDIVWQKKENTEFLLLALENGSMLTIIGRDNIIPSKNQQVTRNGDAELIEKNANEGTELDSTFGDEFGTQPVPKPKDTVDQLGGKKKRLQKASTNNDDDDYDDMVFDNQSENSRTKNPFVADESEENEADEKNTPDEMSDSIQIMHGTSEEPLDTGADADDVNNGDHMQQVDIGDDYGDNFNMDDQQDGVDVHIPEPQAPFAPSSTPLARRRILCWNQHGVISSREREELDGSSSRTIDISFVDSASKRPVSFRDPYNFIIGTIGEEGGLFASDLIEDNDEDPDINLDILNGMSDAARAVVRRSEMRKRGLKSDRATGSCIYFHRFNTFGSIHDKDWTLTLPEGERVLGCASGFGWNAVVTSRRFLRIYSSSGVQGPVIWIKGDPVALVGRNQFLAVIYHEGNPLIDGTQRLAYSMYSGVDGIEIACGSISAISKGSSLTWTGFDNSLSLFVMDDEGILSMLVSSKIDGCSTFSHNWVPILDTMGLKKSREDSFWPVNVHDGKLFCVPLKGLKHPDVVRRPLPTSYPLRIPLAPGSADIDTRMDEVSVRANLALRNKRFVNDFMLSSDGPIDADELETEYDIMCANVDKVTLKLFFSLVKGGKIERAFDLTKRLHLEKSFEIAETAADRCNQMKLTDRIHDLMLTRFQPELFEEEELDFNQEEQSVMDKSSAPTEESFLLARKVSPLSSEKKRKEYDGDDADLQEEPKVRRKLNPFAKMRMQSPQKQMQSPEVTAPKLSRMSTFSTESRRKAKSAKHFL